MSNIVFFRSSLIVDFSVYFECLSVIFFGGGGAPPPPPRAPQRTWAPRPMVIPKREWPIWDSKQNYNINTCISGPTKRNVLLFCYTSRDSKNASSRGSYKFPKSARFTSYHKGLQSPSKRSQCIYIYVHVYIYMIRHKQTYIYIYICIHSIYIQRHRER